MLYEGNKIDMMKKTQSKIALQNWTCEWTLEDKDLMTSVGRDLSLEMATSLNLKPFYTSTLSLFYAFA
jgi:hypothetical protein